MSNVNLFNGCSITVEDTNKTFHTYDTWRLYITNTDCIGNPEQYTNYVTVPGRNGQLDLSDTLTGRPTYIRRQLKIELAGNRPKVSWDLIISYFRNQINGRICKIVFDNDTNHYWRGRVHVDDFSSALRLGKFTMNVEAEPYKYNVKSSAEPWLWNPFNFNSDMITYHDAYTVSGTLQVTIPHGDMDTCPDFVVSNLVGTEITMQYNGVTYTLTSGSNVFADILVNGITDTVLTFTGTAKVEIVYRGGSL